MRSLLIGNKSVTYEDSTHEYHIDGVKVPSITQVIIGGCFHRKPSKPKTGFEPIRDMSSLRRGSKIHEELQDHIAGVASSEKAKAIMGMVCTAGPELYNNPSVNFYSEAIVIGRHRDYQYAGTIDLLAELNDEITVFEIKSGKDVTICNANHIAQVTQYGLKW